MLFEENYIVAEHYKLLRQLGHGSFGNVWLAHNLLADIDVAIKFYGVLDEKGLEEFRNEFRIAYKLHHPNLLNINHFDVYENCPYLVMPYCENGSVSHYIGQISEPEIWKFVLDVSGGLAFLHSQHPPIVHQDIKPDNILITSDGRYVISDFGISRSFRTQMSRTNNNVSSSGTIAYMGPERFSEKPMVVLASDIWAFGMTLYELMTGDVLWEGMGGCVQLNGARLPIIGGNFSDELSKLVTACLAAETWNRPTAAQINEYASAYLQKQKMPTLNIQTNPRTSQAPSTSSHNSPVYSRPEHPNSRENHYRSNLHTPSFNNRGEQGEISYTSRLQYFSNKNLKRGLLLAAALMTCIALISGAVTFFNSISEKNAFVSCQTKQDYEQFIKDYPSSSYAETARKRIAAMAPIMESTLIQAVPKKETTKENVKSIHRKAEEKASEIYITEQAKANDILTNSPQPAQKSSTSADDKTTSDDRAFYRCTTAKDYHAYLTNYPNGRHRKTAEEQLTILLNQSNGNVVETNSNPMPINATGTIRGNRSALPHQGSRRSFSVNFGGGPRGGGGYRSVGNQGGGSRGGGSSHRHSN